MHPKPRIRLAAIAAALIGMLAVATPAAAEDIVVGVPLPMTGYLGPLGVDQHNGVELAVKHRPQVRGMNVKVVFEDTQTKADIALQKAQKLVFQDKAKVLTGLTASSDTMSVAGQSSRLNVPIVTLFAQVNQITGSQCNKLVFRTAPYDAIATKAMALLMKDRPDLQAKKWFVVYHDILWGRDNKAQFAGLPGVKVVGEAGRAPGIADWASTIAQIQASNADGVYLALATGDELPALVRQARDFGLKHTMLVPVGMPDSMLNSIGDSGLGVISAAQLGSWTSEDKNPELERFNKAYFDAYKTAPGQTSLQAYAGMQWILEAINNAKSTSTADIVTSMESTSAKTVLGEMKMRKEDHQATLGVYRAESVKLATPKYGAKVAWKVTRSLTWDEVGVTVAESGCKFAGH
jgi:branched-chain amino acid transport system substrate-binding protein